MDHPYYADSTGFEPARRGSVLSMAQPMRSVGQHELSHRRNSCISPAAELDGKLRNPPRRRVPVACERCRRRKIKCSGDSGDGQGCSNCRGAGNTDCQFLRVNSSKLPFNQFPYPPTGSAIAPSPRLGMYTAHTPGKSALHSIGSSSARVPLQRTADYDVSAIDAHGFPRQSVGMDNSIHYDDEQSANYNGQSPAYMLPSTPSGMIDYGVPAWSPKAWSSMPNTGRPVNGGLFADPEINGSMNPPAYSYVLPTQGILSAEIPPTTTAMADTTSADRTLPTPSTCRNQKPQNNATGLTTMPEGIPGMNLAADFKGPFWNQRCGTSLDQRTASMANVPSHEPYNTSSPPRTKSSGPDPELVFGYLPMSTTSEDLTPALSSTASIPSTTSPDNPPYPGLETLDSSSAADYRTPPAGTRLARSFSREQHNAGQRLLALTTDCTPEIYGYTSSEKTKARAADGADARCSASTLMNGLPYTRVRHPDTPGAFSFNLLPDTLPEYHRPLVENVHRASVSPLGHQAY